MVRPTTLFSQEERIWIIFKYGELKSHAKVRRAFRLHFKVLFKDIPHVKAFKRVYQRFNGGGDISDPKPIKKAVDKVPQEDVQAIERFFQEQPEAHLRDAVRDLGFSLGNNCFGAV